MLTAAGSIGQASGDLLRHIGEGETDERFQVCALLVVVFGVLAYKLGCTATESLVNINDSSLSVSFYRTS